MNLVNTVALLARVPGERCHSGWEFKKGIYGVRSYLLLRPAIRTNIFRYFILANTRITVFEKEIKKKDKFVLSNTWNYAGESRYLVPLILNLSPWQRWEVRVQYIRWPPYHWGRKFLCQWNKSLGGPLSQFGIFWQKKYSIMPGIKLRTF